MILWRIQEGPRYEKLLRTGRLKTDGRRLFGQWRFAYRWMAQQFCRRTSCGKMVYPVWAWYAFDGLARRRPDLRRRWGHKGEPCVRMEFEAPDDQVLLSDYQMWYLVLHNQYIPADEAESELVDQRTRDGQLTRADIEASWERIFDLSFGSEKSWGRFEEREVQACVAEIQLQQVRKVDHFVSR